MKCLKIYMKCRYTNMLRLLYYVAFYITSAVFYWIQILIFISSPTETLINYEVKMMNEKMRYCIWHMMKIENNMLVYKTRLYPVMKKKIKFSIFKFIISFSSMAIDIFFCSFNLIKNIYMTTVLYSTILAA